MRQRSSSPWSSNFGSATFGTLVPESEVVLSAVRSSLPRTFTTCSSPEYAFTVSGQDSSRLLRFRVELPFCQAGHRSSRRFLAEHCLRRRELLALARELHLLGGERVVAAHGLGDLREVALALRRHDDVGARGNLRRGLRQRARLELEALLGQLRRDRVVERGHAVVVEARGDGAEHRHRLGLDAEGLVVALHLLAHVAQRVLRAAAVELVDGDEVGEVEHVDLLELARGAELRRHHVERRVDERHDRRVALADARGLDDDQVVARRPCTRRSRRRSPPRSRCRPRASRASA